MSQEKMIDLVSQPISFTFDQEIFDRLKRGEEITLHEIYDLVLPQVSDPRVKSFYSRALNRLVQIGCGSIGDVYKDWVYHDIITHKFCRYFISVLNNILRGLRLTELSGETE